jgi:uncharacterized membrane protein YhaH (DUF805 family)
MPHAALHFHGATGRQLPLCNDPLKVEKEETQGQGCAFANFRYFQLLGECGTVVWNAFERLDRANFWGWAIFLIIAHLVITFAMVQGAMRYLGAVDTLAILVLALATGGRFRDFGWPAWIPVVFMIATMIVLPMVVIGVAFTNNAKPDMFLDWANLVGLVSGFANILLIVIAGLIPGKPPVKIPEPDSTAARSAN